MTADARHATHDIGALVDDLVAEGDDLDALVAELPDDHWGTATPAPGWTVAHQIAHLAWTDDKALLSMTDPGGFEASLAEAAADPQGFVNHGAERGAQVPPGALLEQWRAGRQAVAVALSEVPPGTRLPWYGPSMGAASMATARLMETWAHGQDIADTFGVTRMPTNRLRHVAWIGVRTRDFAFLAHDLTPPQESFRVELEAPGGDLWSWGPEDAAQRVTGRASDFCLLVTQRRHRDDTAVQATGPDATQWLEIAQAFAGPPGVGRKPGQFS